MLKTTLYICSLLGFILFVLSLLFSGQILKTLGGNSKYSPADMNENLSKKARIVIEKSYEGINKKCLRDIHVHVVGTGKSSSGIWLNPKMYNFYNLKSYLTFKVYMSAAKIDDIFRADEQYVDNLIKLSKDIPGKKNILAFDKNYKSDGTPDNDKTIFYIPNDYVYRISSKFPDHFIPTISIHPDRKDALIELEKWGKRKIKFLKWLPNSMRIDPADKKHIPFYKLLLKYDIALLTHTGEERAVEGDDFQELGNPMRLKLPLDMGVKIIMAHLASLGTCKDLENKNKEVMCFDLFWRLFTNENYKNNLFGEISAITIYTRLGYPLNKILAHPEYHERLVNGSDYPLPAINFIYRTKQMEEMGYITNAERKILNEIYDYNPILFDFVSKRLLKHPETGAKLSPKVFEIPSALGCAES